MKMLKDKIRKYLKKIIYSKRSFSNENIHYIKSIIENIFDKKVLYLEDKSTFEYLRFEIDKYVSINIIYLKNFSNEESEKIKIIYKEHPQLSINDKYSLILKVNLLVKNYFTIHNSFRDIRFQRKIFKVNNSFD